MDNQIFDIFTPGIYSNKRKSDKMISDRFIPNRANIDMDYMNHKLTRTQNNQFESLYKTLNSNDSIQGINNGVNNTGKINIISQTENPKIKYPNAPYKILDIEGVIDNFYFNILDWDDKDTIVISIVESVYLYNVLKNEIIEISELETLGDDYITSLKFYPSKLACGTSSGLLSIYDYNNERLISKTTTTNSMLSTLEWIDNNTIIIGDMNGKINILDLRKSNADAIQYNTCTDKIAGIKYKNNILSSGSNDNKLCLFDIRSNNVLCVKNDYNACVKGLDWCPWDSKILATSAGTGDRRIRIFNTETLEFVNEINTGSQVSSVLYNSNDKTLVSSHGYIDNNLSIWSSSFEKIHDVKNEGRILSLCKNKKSTIFLSACADGKLKFWNLSDEKSIKKNNNRNSLLLSVAPSIR